MKNSGENGDGNKVATKVMLDTPLLLLKVITLFSFFFFCLVEGSFPLATPVKVVSALAEIQRRGEERVGGWGWVNR